MTLFPSLTRLAAMRIPFLLLFLFSLDAHAVDGFSVEDTLSHQEPIPASVSSELSRETDFKGSGCKEKNISEALEATKVNISSRVHEILIKPKAWCLCGAYSCPIWIYQLNNKSIKRIWSTPGTNGVDILDERTHGYRQIKESSGSAGHSYEAIWAWDGVKYKIVKEKSTTAGKEK
ncbi:MAG TPA: hypothetical protein VEP71_01465 [Gallionella sp.]|nr:hypothetical protein [Gallionella sp.]